MRSSLVRLAALCSLGSLLHAADGPPRALDERLEITLFAEHPQIVTPTGIDVDRRGRVWAIESNTHFPPEGYKGHPTDRILVMQDKDGDGKADNPVVFTDGLTHTMSIAVLPEWLLPEPPAGRTTAVRDPKVLSVVYIATRAAIYRAEDVDGDLQCDDIKKIVRLETAGNYPHNGLAGFAFDPLGRMFFGFGENLGADYKIIGSNDTTLSGGGEGGNIYRCELDGTGLQVWATGFWNPHANACDAFGRLFSVDNDADSKPPCRLLHIVRGGDYGYRFRNGRKGLHPFTSWNGEIPGTLPMVAGTGEAPSGVLAYEGTDWPEEYQGNLLVTSWGDHRIDRFRLKEKGASFTSVAEPAIVGGEDFRPVGIAASSDGVLYCTDWVKRDYKLHGHGRVWRIRAKPTNSIPRVARQNAALDSRSLNERRLAARRVATTAEGRKTLLGMTLLGQGRESDRARLEAYWALNHVARDPEIAREVENLTRSIGIPADAKVDRVLRAHAWYAAEYNIRDTAWNRTVVARAVARPKDSGFWIGDPEFSASIGTWDRPTFLVPSEPGFLQFIQDPLVFRLHALRRSQVPPEKLAPHIAATRESSAEVRLLFLLALREGNKCGPEILDQPLKDPDERVRRMAVQWVAEKRWKTQRPNVEAMLNDPRLSSDLFLAVTACLEMLDGKNPASFDQTPASKYVLPILLDANRPAAVQAMAVRLVSPRDPIWTQELMEKLLSAKDETLVRETVRTLSLAPTPDRVARLLPIALDAKRDAGLRADAILGLGHAELTPAEAAAIEKLLTVYDAEIQSETWRAIRGRAAADPKLAGRLAKQVEAMAPLSAITPQHTELAEQLAFALEGTKTDLSVLAPHRSRRPQDAESWLAVAEESGDAERGRRVFYSAHSAGCFKCHTIDGRGGRIGPDLTTIARTMSLEKLVESLLKPSQEVSPQFTTWVMETADGKVLTGMLVFENEGKTFLGDANGKETELKTADIVSRTPQTTSVMPEKLIDRLTMQEFRDLLAFLQTLK